MERRKAAPPQKRTALRKGGLWKTFLLGVGLTFLALGLGSSIFLLGLGVRREGRRRKANPNLKKKGQPASQPQHTEGKKKGKRKSSTTPKKKGGQTAPNRKKYESLGKPSCLGSELAFHLGLGLAFLLLDARNCFCPTPTARGKEKEEVNCSERGRKAPPPTKKERRSTTEERGERQHHSKHHTKERGWLVVNLPAWGQGGPSFLVLWLPLLLGVGFCLPCLVLGLALKPRSGKSMTYRL